MISQGLRTLFWDVDLGEVDPSAHPDYAIFRVLEYGDTDAYTWARETFGDDEMRRVLREERRLSPKSANFWALVYGIPADQIAALAPQP